ncbi:MAG TPA: hypothetical protein PKD64_08495 [Pirellulaceae bacterium]|nr:hypothetical protein [Pirellulaceae bacterium]HMO92225.1 hypothetical protein [Pirellulaceae bacterium]HMP70734.1 hypothetical protein [Pirellulaceae bacterium]
MNSYFHQLTREMNRLVEDAGPAQFGLFVAIAVVACIYLLRGMTFSR